MDKETIKQYKLKGSIHTFSIKSEGAYAGGELPDGVISTAITVKDSIPVTTAIINANKLTGDLFDYGSFVVAVDTILSNTGIEEYKMVRCDFRLDNYDSEHYQRYAKLNRYLISMMAVRYNVRNAYKSDNLFSQEQVSIAIKNKYFELENYDKDFESNSTDAAKARLEERSKYWKQGQTVPEEFLESWFSRWEKAITDENIERVHQKYNDELEKLYFKQKTDHQVHFRTWIDFVLQYQNCIFCRRQLIDLLSRFPEIKNPVESAKYFKKRFHIEYFSKQDIRRAVEEIKRATEEYFINE